VPTRKPKATAKRKRKKNTTAKRTLPKRKRSKVRKSRKSSEARTRLVVKSKLTLKLIGEAKELIEEGLPIDSVCDYLGITQHTYYAWKEKGEKYLIELHTSRGPEFPEDELEAMFMMACAKSRATLELEFIRDLCDDEALARWVRNMTFLERRFRTSWGRAESLRIETESVAPDEAYL
jgi:hypothetical protein